MTMDVERIAEYSPSGGPSTWAFAERSVRSFCELLADEGLRSTLFVVPDTAVEQGTMLRETADQTGAELGMHLHPNSWKEHYLQHERYDCLGGYTADEQRVMLAEALAQTRDGLGIRPLAFRGGNFSASDATFGILTDLGFTHGSLSQPGRAVTAVRAVWTDACADVHRAHRAFRLAPGDLDFIEAPVTTDRERTDHWTGTGDVRFESATPEQVAKAVRQEVSRQVETSAPMKHVCLFTHNYVNYWSDDPKERGRRSVLQRSIAHIRRIADELGLAVCGATLQEVRAAFLGGDEG